MMEYQYNYLLLILIIHNLLATFYGCCVCKAATASDYSALYTLIQDGQTSLFMASQNGHTTTVDLLLRHAADPNIARNVSEFER